MSLDAQDVVAVRVKRLGNHADAFVMMCAVSGLAQVDGTIVRVRGFWAMRYSRRNPLARYSFGWPFGVIEVRENALLLDVPKPYQWLYRASRNTFGRVLDLTLYPPIPLMVPLDAIESITVTAGRFGRGRITSPNPMFSLITFGALGGRFSQVLAALNDQNVLLSGVETTL